MKDNPIIDELVHMIKYIPIAVSDKPNKYAGTLDTNCYHLEESLLKESLQIMYKNADDIDSRIMIPYFLEYKEVSEAAHQRIRDKLYYVRE